MPGVGRELCGSSSPTALLKQGHLQQVAQDLVQEGIIGGQDDCWSELFCSKILFIVAWRWQETKSTILCKCS